METWPGTPIPLGAAYDGAGTNFAVFSDVAEAVELCLFDDDGGETGIGLTERDASVWHAVPAAASGPGSATATGCTARTTRRAGLRCNPTSCCWTPTPARSRASCGLDPAVFGLRARRRRTG